MQIGLTNYSCKYAKCIQFLNYEELITHMQRARVIVCHDGIGTTITALLFDKPIISVPRLKKFGEMFFDNKGDAVSLLATERNIRLIYDIDELKSALSDIDSEVIHVQTKNHESLINSLAKFINDLNP